MTNKDLIINEYFEWLSEIVCGRRYSDNISYRKLLVFLHQTEFQWIIPGDESRADDGVDLRYRFACERDGDVDEVLWYLCGPCSVLEMMIALAIRCEEGIMDDPQIGDRTGQWFWGMITNLELGSMMDIRFDRKLAEKKIARFLNREYDPDGRGGLFHIRDFDKDLREFEIWYQLCWFLGTIT
jgi:hypothetical protein